VIDIMVTGTREIEITGTETKMIDIGLEMMRVRP